MLGLNLSIITKGVDSGARHVGVMLILGPLMGRTVARIGALPVLFVAVAILITGLFLFIFNRSSTERILLEAAVALAGVVSLISPIDNMVSVSVPRESVAVSLGVDTILRNIGGAIGPVATSIITSYTSALIIIVQGQTIVGPQLANVMAFNTIFGIGIALTIAVLAISLTRKNSTFKK